MQQKTNTIQILAVEMPPKNQKFDFQMRKETKQKMDEAQCSIPVEGLKNQERDLWFEIEKINCLAKNEAYMEFKDYVYTRQFFSTNFQQLKKFYPQTQYIVFQPSSHHQSKVKSLQGNWNISFPINEQKNVHQSYQTQLKQMIPNFLQLNYYDFFHIGLLLAKSFFIANQYQKCHYAIIIFVPLNVKLTFKILYERQALLIKTIFLLNKGQKQTLTLLNYALKQYDYFSEKCVDWQSNKNITKIYRAVLENLINITKESFILAKKKNKNELIAFLQKFLSLCGNSNEVFFPGFPVYLVSNHWIKRAKEYLKSPTISKPPGSLFNFQLLNHLFEFQGHVTEDKFYMDTVLFPFTQNIDFTFVNGNVWKWACEQIGGYPIKRFPNKGKDFKTQLTSDTLVKTLLSINDKLFLFQWQAGTYWQHSILPYLNQKYFRFEGLGQMKYSQQRVNKRNQSYQQVGIVRGGIIEQKKCLYRYYEINSKLRKRIKKQQLKKLITKYDLQDYYIRKQKINSYSLAIIGMHDIKESVTKFFQELEINQLIANQNEDIREKSKKTYPVISSEMASTSEYLSCIIHCISNLQEIVTLFVTNDYATFLKADLKDHALQFCIAFAHLLKHLWFSDFRKDSVDASSFIKALLHNKMMQKTGKQLKKQEDIKMVEEIILYLHMALNSGEGARQILKLPIYSSIQPLEVQCIPFFQKINNSPICKIFKQFHYQIYSCIHCAGVIGYKLVPTLTLDINVPEYFEYLKMYFVSNQKKRKASFQSNSNSVKWLYKQAVSKSDRNEKFVQEINFKLRKSQTIAHVYNLMAEKYSLNLTNDSNQLITMIIDEYAQNFQIIYTSKDIGKKDISISWINNLISQSNQGDKIILQNLGQKQGKGSIKSKKIIVITFLITEPTEEKQLFFVTFRSTKQKQVKGFPEIINIPKTSLHDLQASSNQRGKQLLRSLISDPQIQIQNYEVKEIKNNILVGGTNMVKKKINIYTNSKLWLVQRTLKYLNIEQKESEKSEQQCPTLEECLKMRYCDQSGDLTNNKPEQKFAEEEVTCYRCKKTVKSRIKRRILKLNQTLIISVVRNQQKFGVKSINKMKFPLKGLNMAPFINQSSKKRINYNLRAALFYSKRQLNMKQMYYCIAQNCVNDKWYKYRNQKIEQVDICKIENDGVEILFYEREFNEDKQVT